MGLAIEAAGQVAFAPSLLVLGLLMCVMLPVLRQV
jgi:hypothetical protein